MKLVVAFCVVAAAMAQTRNQQTGQIDTAVAYNTDVPNRRGADALKTGAPAKTSTQYGAHHPSTQTADALATSANTALENNAGQLNNPNFKVTQDKQTGVKYDFAGRVTPDLSHAKYNPVDAKQCCKGKCNGTKHCEIGCDMWMAYSSLNWEPSKWRTALRERCQAQCLQPRRWAHAHEKAQSTDHAGKKVSSSYWHQGKFSAMLEKPFDTATLPYPYQACKADSECQGTGAQCVNSQCINSAEKNCRWGCWNFNKCQVAQAL